MDVTEQFVEIVNRPEPEIPLDVPALLIAAHAHPDLDLDARLDQLDELAAQVPSPSAVSPATELAAYLFASGRFTGNTIDYADPANSYLDDVLDRHLGLPITLSVLMIEVGRRRGVALHGVGMPGHFLVGAGDGEWYDPFGGGTRLDAAACATRFVETHGSAAFHPEFLLPTPPTRILDRMLANLQRSLLARSPGSVAWVIRLRLRIPRISVEQRVELAGWLGHVGHFSEAARELDVIASEVATNDPTRAARSTEAAARLRARAN